MKLERIDITKNGKKIAEAKSKEKQRRGQGKGKQGRKIILQKKDRREKKKKW